MQTLKEKYQARQKRKDDKAYEEWKQSQSKSSIKKGLLFVVLMSVIMPLHRFADKYYFDEIYSLDRLKEDFIFIFITSLFGGAVIAYSINRKYQKRMREEIADGKF